MGAPLHLLEEMRDDTLVLTMIAATDSVPFTTATLGAVARWFDDVEIRYPIAEMAFDPAERRNLVHTAANEMLQLFTAAANQAKATGELNDEDFEKLAKAVDPLWRELTGMFATEMNARFEENRVPAEHSDGFLRMIMSRMRDEHGDEAAEEFRNAIANDTNLRAQLRRMGIDPDQA